MNPENHEVAVPQFTREEYDWIGKAAFDNPEDPKVVEMMSEKGISYDTEYMEVMIDGKLYEMSTRKDDFGTAIEKS